MADPTFPTDITDDVDPENWLLNYRQGPVTSAINALHDNPDEAAQAVKTGDALGIPPTVVNWDFDNYQKQFKEKIASELIQNNEHLRDYVSSHPLAASVSNDDWGQLDTISEAMDNLSPHIAESPFWRIQKALMDKSVGAAAVQGFWQGHGSRVGLSEEDINKIFAVSNSPFVQNLIGSLGVGKAIGQEGFNIISGLLSGGAAGVAQLYRNATGDEAGAEKLAEELKVLAQVSIPEMARFPISPELNAIAGKAVETGRNVSPWIGAGKRPPTTSDAMVRQLAEEEAKVDIKAFDELYKGTQRSSTLPRDPEAFSAFGKLKFGDSTIGISADKIRELYGDDEVPTPGDNKLGWAPHIEAQVDFARRSGAEVQIPIAEFLAKASPETVKTVHDGIRLRYNGLTLDEVAEGKPVTLKMEEAPQPLAMEVGAPREEEALPLSTLELARGRPNEEELLRFRLGQITRDAAMSRKLGEEPNMAEARQIRARLRELQNPLAIVRESSGLVPKGWDVVEPAILPGIIPEKSLLGAVGEVEQTPRGGQTLKATPKQSFTLSEGLAQIDKSRLAGIPRALSEIFGDRLNRLVGNTPVHILNHEDWDVMVHSVFPQRGDRVAGWYDPSTHQIFLREDVASGSRGHEAAANLLMHEGSHALTSRALDQFPELNIAVGAMLNETKKYLKGLPDSPDIQAIRKAMEYGLTDTHEFLSESHSNKIFQEALATTPISRDLANAIGLGRGPQTMWDAFRHIIRKLFKELIGWEPDDTMLDALLKVQEHIEEAQKYIGEPEGLGPAAKAAIEASPEESALFKQASVIGMNKDRLGKLTSDITKLREENAKFSKDQAIFQAGAAATKDWKDNLPRVREEVKQVLLSRPDIAADRFLRTGELPNGQKGPRGILRVDDPELRARLPQDYVGAKGASPDDLASAFGYQSGKELLDGLANLEQARQMEGATPASHLRSLVDAETQRRMNQEYGRSAAQLLEETKEQAVSPTQMDLLHNFLEALYEKVGQKPITKEALKAEVRFHFDRIPNHMHDSDRYLEAAGKAGDRFGEALLDNKPIEALQAKQHQIFLLHTAKLAMDLEKNLDRFYKLADKYRKPQPTGVDPETTTFIQQVLTRVLDRGVVRRTEQGLARQQELLSPRKTLADFVDYVNSNKGVYTADPDVLNTSAELPRPGFLVDDPDFRMRIMDMPPELFNPTHQLIKAMDKYAREVGTTEVKRKKRILSEVVGGLAARIEARVDGKVATQDRRSVMATIGASILNPESWFKSLDLGDNRGPFMELILRRIMAGQYEKATKKREYSKLYRALDPDGSVGDTRRKISNNLFMNPQTKFQTPMEMTKLNLLAVLQNIGNPDQLTKLAAGYGIKDPQSIMTWLHAKTAVGELTKADWERAPKIGELFDRAFSENEKMRSELYGWVPERIFVGEVETPFGTVPGWYHPLIPDPVRHGKLSAAEMLDNTGVYRPMPSAGFAKTRQAGARYPIQLNFDAVPKRLEEVINDTAMRTPITEVSKLVFHDDFRNAFTRYFGKEYMKGLEQWLQDSAGVGRFRPGAEGAAEQVANSLRKNMSTLLIGWNLGTFLKHLPTAAIFSAKAGGLRFWDSANRMIWQIGNGHERWSFAFDKSQELQNRIQSASESLSATNQELWRSYNWNHKFFTIQDAIHLVGSMPVAMSDLISAVPLWDAAYRKAIESGLEHGEAVYEADTAVRQTHGTTLTAGRAGILRAGPVAQTFMPFYNFFSNALQRNYEYAWKAKLMLTGRELPEMTGFERQQYERGLKHLPEVLGGFLTYNVLVSIIEQIVDPIPYDEDESPFWWGAKVLARGPVAMIPFARDVQNFVFEGHSPSAGVVGTAMRDFGEPLVDIAKALSGKEYDPDPAKTIRHFNAAFGALTGMTFDELGKIGQFTYNYMQENEDLEDFGDIYKVIRHGTVKEKTKRPILGPMSDE